MGNSKNGRTQRILKLDTRTQWADEPYVGYVLEVVNKYLDFKMTGYNLGGGAKLFDRKSAVMTNGNEETIRVTRFDNGKYYFIDGWPDDKYWFLFRWKAKGLLKKFLDGKV